MLFLRGDDGVKGRRPLAAAALRAALDTIIAPKRMLPSDQGRLQAVCHLYLTSDTARWLSRTQMNGQALHAVLILALSVTWCVACIGRDTQTLLQEKEAE